VPIIFLKETIMSKKGSNSTSRPANGPSTTGNPSGKGRGNNPPSPKK